MQVLTMHPYPMIHFRGTASLNLLPVQYLPAIKFWFSCMIDKDTIHTTETHEPDPPPWCGDFSGFGKLRIASYTTSTIYQKNRTRYRNGTSKHMRKYRSFRSGAYCYHVRASTTFGEISKAGRLVPGEPVEVKSVVLS